MLRELLGSWCKPRQNLAVSTAPGHGTPAEVRPSHHDDCPCGAKWVAYDAALGGFSRQTLEERFCREFVAAAPGACEVKWETLLRADPVVEVLWGRRVGEPQIRRGGGVRGSMNAMRAPKVGAAALGALVCALALAAAAAGAAPEAPGGEITPGKGVGPISLGMPRDDLVRLWGPSERAGERDQDGVVLHDYSGPQGVLVFLKDDRVVQLVVVTPAWSTPSGARVGATWPEVRAFLGQPDETLPGQTKDESRYLYKQRGIAFILKGRAVAAIVVLAAQGPPPSKGPLDDILGTGKGRGQGGK